MQPASGAEQGMYFNEKLASAGLSAAVLAHMDVGVCIVDGDLKVIAINPLACEILDLPADLIRTGLTLETLIRYNAARGDFGDGPVEDLVRERLDLARSVEADSFQFNQADGSPVHVRRSLLLDGGFITTYSRASSGASAQPASKVGGLDEVEDQLLTAQQAAAEADNNKRQMLANISHELRTPMDGLLGMADLLSKTELTAKQRHFVRTIDKSGRALLTLIDDMVEFAGIDAGRLSLRAEPFQLAAVVDDVATLMSAAAADKSIELAVKVAPDLPEAFIGDAPRLRQVMTGLLSNAVRFTNEGHVLADISGEVADEHARLTVRIEDTGIGIADHQLGDIFDAASQGASSLNREHDGSGLDLATANRLIELMGGSLKAESDPGKGSSFWFSIDLPVHREKEVSELMPGRILFAAQDDSAADALGAVLADTDCDLQIAHNGAEALQLYRSFPPDVILMDLDLPRISGFEVASAIRSGETDDDRRTPIIGVIDGDDPGQREKCLEAGMDDCLASPASREQLLAMLAKWLDPAVEEAAPAPVTAPAAVVVPDGPPLRMLFAEDNDVNQEVFLELLDDQPFDVTPVSNGREAVVRFIADPSAYDVVVLDMSMPVMSGYEATEAIRAHEKVKGLNAIPIVGISADATEEHRHKALDSGVDEYLVKPVDVDALLSCLGKCRGERSLDQLKQTAEQMAAAVGKVSDEPALTMADIARKFKAG